MDNSETNEQFARRMRTRRGAPVCEEPIPIFGHYRVLRAVERTPLGQDKQVFLLWLYRARGAALGVATLSAERARAVMRPCQGSPAYIASLYDHEVPDSWLPHKLK